jgi:hypothetical protein
LWLSTLAVVALWCVAASLTLWSGFPAGPLVQVILLATSAYGVGLALFRSRPGWVRR